MQIPSPPEMTQLIFELPAAGPLRALSVDAGPPVYIVGGAVRDVLLGGKPVDLDLVVEGDARAVAERLGNDTRVHDRFGTCTVTVDGHVYDIAMSRRERYEHPGALPDVEPAPLAEDLLRRDFTINALAVSLNGPSPGTLTAAPRALEDLERGQLRVLHERSFIDDPTRLLRLARYCARLRYPPERQTLKLAMTAIEAGAPDTVSGERVGAELRLLAREEEPVVALQALNELELGEAIEPGFGLDEAGVARAALELLPSDGRRDSLVLAVAARRLSQGKLERLLERLAFPAGERDLIIASALGASPLAERLKEAVAPSEIYAAVAGAPCEEVALAGALGAREQATAWLQRLRHVRLAIGGDDLLAAGVPAGPAIGRGLRAALRASIDGEAGDRDAELERALLAARESDRSV